MSILKLYLGILLDERMLEEWITLREKMLHALGSFSIA